MKKSKTHSKITGQEFGEMFISDDGLMSVFFNDDECEVTGYMFTIFADAFLCKIK